MLLMLILRCTSCHGSCHSHPAASAHAASLDILSAAVYVPCDSTRTHCRYGYTEAPDQGSAFVETVLLTVLSKLYKELHSTIQNSQELSDRFPALAASPLIAAVSPSPPVSPAGHPPGATVMGPVPDPMLSLMSQDSVETPAGRTSSVKPLVNKALQGRAHDS